MFLLQLVQFNFYHLYLNKEEDNKIIYMCVWKSEICVKLVYKFLNWTIKFSTFKRYLTLKIFFNIWNGNVNFCLLRCLDWHFFLSFFLLSIHNIWVGRFELHTSWSLAHMYTSWIMHDLTIDLSSYFSFNHKFKSYSTNTFC